MDGMLALTIVCVIFAIGDFISDRTNAVLSVLLFATLAFLILFWTGTIPSTIFADAGISQISTMVLGMFIVNMGSLLELKEFIAQWKTVVLGLAIVILGGILMFFVAIPIIGNNNAVAIVGPITGGFVSAIVVADAATPLGLTGVTLLSTIIVAIQGVIGYPLASLFLKKEAHRLVKGYHAGTIAWTPVLVDDATTATPKKRLFPATPAKMQTPFVLLAKCAFVSLVSFQLAGLTNGIINKFVLCLIMGVLARELGLIEYDILKKANTYGLGILVCMVSILTNLTKVTPQDVLSMLPVLLISFAIGLTCLFLVAIVVGKIFRFSWQMCCGIACSCLFGFPGTYIVSNEIANKVGKTPEEVQLLTDNILPKMLVAGFICLTVTSVVITGVFVNYLVV